MVFNVVTSSVGFELTTSRFSVNKCSSKVTTVDDIQPSLGGPQDKVKGRRWRSLHSVTCDQNRNQFLSTSFKNFQFIRHVKCRLETTGDADHWLSVTRFPLVNVLNYFWSRTWNNLTGLKPTLVVTRTLTILTLDDQVLILVTYLPTLHRL